MGDADAESPDVRRDLIIKQQRRVTLATEGSLPD